MVSSKSSSAYHSRNYNRTSTWSMFWTVVLWIVVILVSIYVAIALTIAYFYHRTRRSLEQFTLKNIQKLSSDTGEVYDFTVDARGVVPMNVQLSKDMVVALMQYYGNNLNTVMTIVDNYTTEGSAHVSLFDASLLQSIRRRVSSPSSMEGDRTIVPQDIPDVFSSTFQEDATKFISHTSSSFPPDVLARTQFYSRFFSMVLATVSDPAKADAISALWEWIQTHLS